MNSDNRRRKVIGASIFLATTTFMIVFLITTKQVSNHPRETQSKVNNFKQTVVTKSQPAENHLQHEITNSSTSNSKIPLNFQVISIMDITTQNAPGLLDRIKREIPNIEARSVLTSLVIGKLCQQGFYENAWGLIDEDHGMLRTSALIVFFEKTNFKNPDTAKKYIDSISDKTELQMSISSLVQSNPEIAIALDNSVIPGNTDEGKIGFSRGMAAALRSDDISPDLSKKLTDRAIQLAGLGKIDAPLLENILNSDRQGSPFDHWTTLGALNNQLDKKTIESLRGKLTGAMLRSDSSRAMDILCNDPETKYSYPVISAAIHSFYDLSASDANLWMTNNLDRIDPATSQRIISCLAQVSNQNLEFETSRKWANRILNAEVRQQLLDQVDKREAEKSKQPPK